MGMPSKFRGVALAWACSLAAPCFAQSTTNEDLARLANLPLEELVNTRVTSISGRPGTRFTTPAAVSVISAEDIRRSGARSVVEALRLVPGFYVAQINAGSWIAGARGLAGSALTANRYLVMVDGRSVYDPLTSTTWWDSLDLPLSEIDRIEVVRGPGASLWGVNAMQGVIQIVTKRAAETQGAFVKAKLGTNGNDSVLARYGASPSETTSYRVYAKYEHHGAFEDVNGRSIEDQWASLRGGFRVDGALTPQTTFTVQGDAYMHPQAHATVQIPVFGQDRRFMTASGDDTVEGGSLLFRALHGFEDERGWLLRAWTARTVRDNARFGVARNTFDVEYRRWLPWGEQNQFIWGLQYDVTRDNVRNGAQLFVDPTRRTWSTLNAFVQNTTELVPERLFLMLGTKVTDHAFVKPQWQPNVRAWWTPSERQTLWFSAARPVRVPSRFEENGALVFSWFDVGAVTTGTPNGNILPIALAGNDQLRPERMVALEAGHRWQVTDRWAIDTALFHHDHQRLIEPPPAVFGTFTDKASGESWGGDFSVSGRITDRWRVDGSYSRLRVRIDGPAFPFDETSSPSELAQFHSYYDVRDDFEFNAAVYHVGRVPFNAIPAYTRTDIGFTWRPRHGLELALWGQNVFDPNHAEASGAQVPRTAYLQVTFDLGH